MFWRIIFESDNIKNNDIDIIDSNTLKLFLNDEDYITFVLNCNIWCSELNLGSDLQSCEKSLNYVKLIKNKLFKNNINCNCLIVN